LPPDAVLRPRTHPSARPATTAPADCRHNRPICA
jgi:hypothetical protein